MSGERRFSPRRFKDLALYIIQKHPEGIEETKLRWLMFHADMNAYRLLGRSITGASYLKGEDGAPIPAHYGKAGPDRRLKENREGSGSASSRRDVGARSDAKEPLGSADPGKAGA